MQALLHRGRERALMCSMCAGQDLCRTVLNQSFCDLHIPFKKLRDFSNVQYEVAPTSVSNGALTSPNGDVWDHFNMVRQGPPTATP